jgi:hypothetical protein
MSHLLNKVQMKAFGCILHLRSKEAQVRFHSVLTPLASQLELDDVGYFYDPNHEDRVLTVPGQFVGVLNNTTLPSFQLGLATVKAVDVLNSIDEDYDKLLIVITDYAKVTDWYYFNQAVSKKNNIKVKFHLANDKIDYEGEKVSLDNLILEAERFFSPSSTPSINNESA